MSSKFASAGTSSLKIKCRSGSGSSVELDVVDLSQGGCMAERRNWSPSAGDRVLVQLPGLGFQASEVVWIEDGRVGIGFEQALHDAVFEHLRTSFGLVA